MTEVPPQVLDDPKFLDDFLRDIDQIDQPLEPEEPLFNPSILVGYFAFTAFMQPFNVTTTLLQISCKSHKPIEMEAPQEDDVDEETKFKKSLKQYDQYLKKFSGKRSDFKASVDSDIEKLPTDSFGYVQDEPKNQYYIPLNQSHSIYQNAKTITKYLGWTGLWRAQLSSFVYLYGTSTVQPFVEIAFCRLLDVDPEIAWSQTPNFSYALLGHFGSHFVTGVLFHPLYLVLNRLIYQPIVKKNHFLTGALSGLYTTFKTEGFFNHLTFTLSFYAIDPILRYSSEIVYEKFLRDDTWRSKILYVALEASMLLIRLPLVTVFKRLLVPKDKKTCVETNTYTGGLNCISRMIREEKLSSLYIGWRYHAAFACLKVVTEILEEGE